MTPGRNRERVRAYDPFDDFGEFKLADAPENPEFLEFAQEFQDRIAKRFDEGIEKREDYDFIQRKATQRASSDCAQRLRDAAIKRASGAATLADAVTSRRRDRRPARVR